MSDGFLLKRNREDMQFGERNSRTVFNAWPVYGEALPDTPENGRQPREASVKVASDLSASE